jgi:hypothetical protein
VTLGYTSSVFYPAPFLDLYITTQLLCFDTVPKLLSKPICSREYIILIHVHSPNLNTQTTAHNDSVST